MFLDKSFCDRSKPPVCWVLMAAVKYVGAMFPCLLKLFLTFSLSGLGPLINLSFRIINQANPRHRNGTVKKHLNKTTHWKKTGVFYWEAWKQTLVNNTWKSHFALLSRHLLLTILRGYSLWWESTLFAIIESWTIKQQDFRYHSWFHNTQDCLETL